MPNPITPENSDYHSALQKYEVMRREERRMNDPRISSTQRDKAVRQFKMYRNMLKSRNYCTKCKPIV